jgi:hypothetical protein
MMSPSSMTLSAAAPTANLIVLDLRQVPCDQVFHNRPDLCAFAIMIDINPHLPETHQGSHPNASNDQGIDFVPGQEVDGDHTPSLNMLLVGNRGHLFDLTAFHIHQSKHVTMAEVA